MMQQLLKTFLFRVLGIEILISASSLTLFPACPIKEIYFIQTTLFYIVIRRLFSSIFIAWFTNYQ